MARKIAINGFGRIGRCVLRAMVQAGEKDVEVVAINDLTDAKTLVHLFKHDSIHGSFTRYDVGANEGGMRVAGRDIKILAEKDPTKLPWRDLGVDFVLECTGRFTDGPGCSKHLEAGARRVLLSAPTKGEADADIFTLVYGVNHEQYDPARYTIVSNASCTTNCLAPMAKVLHETVGIVKGQMTTVHSYTNDQVILDLPHKDLRRARAASMSMIPTTTGAARAVGLVLPALKGRLDGFAIRVPTPDVSLVVLAASVGRRTTKDEVNNALRAAAAGPLKGVLAVSDEPLVSVDYIGNPASSTVDAALTQVIDGDFVSVSSWYDNEWGFSQRMVDTLKHLAAREP
ncbi:MAG: type I glyceraldehyde-3-phosphate dehydrogenase [Deltaproteobacteria bacterium]|nr:type I glyceraldehyde-3-phosphate dehydrogenase [Deltaproteobacteria bacterium]